MMIHSSERKIIVHNNPGHLLNPAQIEIQTREDRRTSGTTRTGDERYDSHLRGPAVCLNDGNWATRVTL